MIAEQTSRSGSMRDFASRRSPAAKPRRQTPTGLARRDRPVIPIRRAPKRVAVLVDTSTSWGRGVLEGIDSYCRENSGWEIFVEPRGQLERLRLPRGWRGDGVIARITSPQLAEELQVARLPVVNVSGIKLAASAGYPRVTTDLHASGSMAARHFLERGFRNFAYLDLDGLGYVQEHRQAFEQTVTRAGAQFTVRTLRPAAGAEPDWRLDLEQLGEWVRCLPKPVALVCWNAGSAREVIFACHEAGIHVPEEVAVLAQADDELLCGTGLIPISGIAVASNRIGYQAAVALGRLMQGKAAAASTMLIAPVSIVTRQSTQTVAMTDPLLVKAMSYIRQNAANPSLSVPEVAQCAGASRRVLERRFASVLKRSPAEEIRRLRLEIARRLLVQSSLPMPNVAYAAGFCSQSHFCVSFTQRFGLSPLRFRKQNNGKPLVFEAH
jgi:LacI family transcriptional regulator